MKRNTVMLIGFALSISACGKVGFNKVDDGSFTAAGVKTNAVSQNISVNSDDQVDILFVVDNSGSMKEEQANFSSKINGFMDLVKDLDWHVALTTTDARINTVDKNKVERAWGDGQFRPFDSDTGSVFVLKAGEVSLGTAQAQLAAAIEVGLLGSGDERAVNSTYRAVQRAASTPANKDFFRPKARLAVIVISDENECSDGKCLATQPTDVPANLLSLVKSTFGNDKIFTFNSIAKMAADTTCTTATLGSVYETMSQITDGVTGSVCASDYTPLLSKLGTRVKDLVKSVQLGCEPADMNGDGKGDVTLMGASGERMTTGFSVTGRLVTFDQALSDGLHTFEYHCVAP